MACGLLAVASSARAQLGDPVRLPLRVDRETAVFDVTSGPGHGAALSLFDRRPRQTVAYEDARGRWHRFAVPGTVLFRVPHALHLAQLESGGAIAAWDRGDAIFVRTWKADGALAPARAVITGIDPGLHGDNETDSWRFSADRTGTIAIAAAGPNEGTWGVYATARDAGRDFLPPQEVSPRQPRNDQARLTVSPISADGSVTVSWQDGGATRSGRSTVFGPPVAPVLTDPALRQADDSRTIRVGPGLQRLCGECSQPRLFTWPSKQVIAVRANERWYVSARQADGIFDHPRPVTRDIGARPLWTKRPGVVAFTRNALGYLWTIPFGVPPRKPVPIHTVGATSRYGALTIEAMCSVACRLNGRRREPLELTRLTFQLARNATRARVTLRARDTRGRVTTLTKVWKRAGRAGEGRVWR